MKTFAKFTLVMGLVLSFLSANATSKNVVLSVDRFSQHDSLGFNFTEYFSYVLYKHLNNNDVVVYENEKKNYRIKPAQIERMQSKLNVYFTDANEILVHQELVEENGVYNVITKGFSIVKRREGNLQDICFGYIEYKDVENIMANNLVYTNAQGYFNLDLKRVVDNRFFGFDIYEFDAKPIANENRSEKLKTRYFENSITPGAEPIARERLITFDVNRNDNNGQMDAYFQVIENHLKNNQEEFFSMGGDKYFNFIFSAEDFKVSKIEVEEVVSVNGQKENSPKTLKIYINDNLALDAISVEEFMSWNLPNATNQEIVSVLANKNFNFFVKKINNQEIYEQNDNSMARL